MAYAYHHPILRYAVRVRRTVRRASMLPMRYWAFAFMAASYAFVGTFIVLCVQWPHDRAGVGAEAFVFAISPLSMLMVWLWVIIGFAYEPVRSTLCILAYFVGMFGCIQFFLGRQTRRGKCRVCGYDLRATPEQCPECGTPTGRQPAVTKRLQSAGWRPGRDVWSQLKLPWALPVFPVAKRVLSEFGNLQLGDFTETISLDPSVGDEIAYEITEFEKQLGRRLYPLGFLESQDRIYLLIDDRGVIYKFVDELEPVASSFEVVLDYLVLDTGESQQIERDLAPLDLAGKVWRLNSERGTEISREDDR